MKVDKNIFLILPLKPVLQFKEQVPFKCKNKVPPGSMRKEDLFTDTTFDPSQFSLDRSFNTKHLTDLELSGWNATNQARYCFHMAVKINFKFE